MLPMIPTKLVVWGAFTLCFLALLAYRATVTRYEDDQLFLSEEGGTHIHQQHQQDAIHRKVHQATLALRSALTITRTQQVSSSTLFLNSI